MQPEAVETLTPGDRRTGDPGPPLLHHGARQRIGQIAGRLSVATLVIVAAIAFLYWRRSTDAIQQARRHAQELAERAALSIDQQLGPIGPRLRAVADSVAAGTLARAQLLDHLHDLAELSPLLSGVGVAYAPTAYDPGLQLYAPSYIRRGDRLELVQMDSLYDYTEPGYGWYHGPLKSGPGWSEPYENDVIAGPLVDFGVPFRFPGRTGEPTGVIHATVQLREIDGIVGSLDLGEEGYTVLVSSQGAVISHPLVNSADRLAVDSVGDARVDGVVPMVKALAGKPGGSIDNITDPATGEPSWMIVQPVPSTGWTVGIVYFRDSASVHPVAFRHIQIWLLLAVLASAMLIGTALLARSRLTPVVAAWCVVALFTGLTGAGIGFIWYTAYVAPLENPYDVVFASQATLRNFRIERTRQALRQNADLPVYIPTGVFVQSLEFLSANNVSFTGYVWQRYPKGLPAEFTRGFVLPEAVSSTVTEAYRRMEGDDEVIGWQVHAELRETFDYAHYPLDQQAIWLRFWHPDLDRNVILVPDFSSYQLIHPLLRPGVEQDFVLPGWSIRKTYFAYRRNQYNATFGVQRPGGQHDLPELYFHVAVTREILNPFFSHLLPVTVAAFMVFALLLMVGPFKEFSAIEVLATCAALFFVIILAQLDLRGKLGSEHILYIEYFYFVMYAALLLVSLDAILIGLDLHGRLLAYRDNLLAKLIFWPVMQALLLGVTVWVFY